MFVTSNYVTKPSIIKRLPFDYTYVYDATVERLGIYLIPSRLALTPEPHQLGEFKPYLFHINAI